MTGEKKAYHIHVSLFAGFYDNHTAALSDFGTISFFSFGCE